MRRLLVLVAAATLGAGAVFGAGARPVSADGGTGAASGSTPAPPASAIIATAEQYVGYPYAYIGDDPSTGFSCIGFVHYIFAQNGVYVPEDLGKAYASAPQVDQSALQPGDLVFFQNTVWNGISHVDLYVGDGKMIGADTFQTGVQWDNLSDAYWQEHYLGATRPLSNPTGTPVDPSATPAPSSGPSLAPPSGPSLTVQAGVTLTPLHAATVYSGPGAGYSSVDTVTPGTQLTAVQAQGQWVNVSYNGGSEYGWVHGPDLNLPASARGANSSATTNGTTSGSNNSSSTSGNSSSATSNGSSTTSNSGTNTAGSASVAGQTLLVKVKALPVYSSPSTSGDVLVTLTAGIPVVVVQSHRGWYQVTLPDGTVGWVDARNLAAHAGTSAGGNSGSASTSDSGNSGSASASGDGNSGNAGASGGGNGANGGNASASPTPAAGSSSTSHTRTQTVLGFHATHRSSGKASKGRLVVVTADVLFVRAGPDTHARILRRVHAGDRLSVLTSGHGWDYVSLRDRSRGWVSARWVRTAKAA